MSKGAWSSWFGVGIVVAIYGLLEKEPSLYWREAGIGLLIGLIPLYIIDRLLRRRK